MLQSSEVRQSESEESGLRKTKPNRDDCIKARFPVCLIKRMVYIFLKIKRGT